MTDFGVSMFPTDYAIQPPELGREVEARGFESLWFPEHTHIPTSRISPWPGGGDLPQEYWHTHDPFVSLMAAAAATETIKVGTGILLVPEHDVLVSAKSAASLDMISGGRLILGIGAGWNAEELENHGWNFKDRWKVTREIVLAWRELWTQDEPEFHGEFIDFDPVWSYPKPVQENGPTSCSARSPNGPSTASSTTATVGCRSHCAATCEPTWSSSRRQPTAPIAISTRSTAPSSASVPTRSRSRT